MTRIAFAFFRTRLNDYLFSFNLFLAIVFSIENKRARLKAR